jgi:hypothetical protein
MSQQLRDVDIKILEPDNNAINDYYIPPTYKRQTDMLVNSNRHDITEILLKVALNTII